MRRWSKKMTATLQKSPFVLVLACTVIGITGCVAIPPDQDVLPRQDMTKVQLAADIKLARDGWPQAQWWTQYGDPQLDNLIGHALADSPDLKAAAARIGAAQAVLTINKASEGIGAGFNAGVNRQRYSGNGLFPPPIGGNAFTDESLQLQARYDFDWWGKRRSQIAAVLGETNARRADYAQAEQTLAAVIAQTYFNLQSGWARLANLRKMAALQHDLLMDQIKRVAHGLGSIDDQHLAEAHLSELKEQIAQLDAQTIHEREALRALVGADSNAFADLKPVAAPGLSHAMPSKLGVELLARRPDLQAARWRVEASLDRTEVAKAAFYPDINLTGSFGLDAMSLNRLFEADSRTFLVGPVLSLPLFNSKALQGRLDAARNERNELIADYNQSVLNAVCEVAQAGAALQGIETQLRQQADVMASTGAMLRAAQSRFKHGLADHAKMLHAEMAALQQRDIDLQLQHQRLLAEVALTKALGGGYRAGTPETQTTLAHSLN